MVLLLVPVALVAHALRGGAPAGDPPPHGGPRGGPAVLVARQSYVVRPGDTLWSIARAVEPHGDVRPVVDRLHRSRQGRPLRAGERIVLP